MSTPAHTDIPLDLRALALAIDTVLDEFLDSKAAAADGHDPVPLEAVEVMRGFLGAGGERLRPLLCMIGSTAGGSSSLLEEPVVRLAASLDMFHAFRTRP
ncbi:polyprenyl synthetase family protein [Streptomyces sp. NRRL B-1347]|uniref:polyprenyl synthetase family protein n=1 Tax=Streptomyces sp. NRRL B-1347 TaxID=1476877 RepID=UPI000A440071|nr:polyprenyl synthetase family protein [Streptomyces sp. NRRL B-1347]